MLKYIPHKNKPLSWRTFLFIFFVTVISATGAYFVHAYSKISQKNTIKLEVNNIQPVPEATTVSTDIPVTSEVLSVSESNTSSDNKLLEAAVKSPLIPAAERNKNPVTRLEEARQYAQPQILSGKYIDVSLRYQNMVIFEDGKALDAYQISSGKKGLDTPVGTFKIENKSPKAWSKKYGLWMPNWMAFLPSGEMGIHELPIWPGGYQEGAKHLGIPVSHGCVRLGAGAAKRVYDWAEIGTPVIIHQ